MPRYLYNDWIKTLASRFDAELLTIEANHNFELGPEFEIVLCKILRSALPDKYGICRGYVVNRDGSLAGDDIVIYEGSRFPTLALRDRDDFSRKEYIPAEAAYCYIEAKHSVSLEDESAQSLLGACDQASAVRAIMTSRPEVPHTALSHTLNLTPPLTVNMSEEFPLFANPPFSIVFARHIRSKGKPISAEQAQVILAPWKLPSAHPIDLAVLGPDLLLIPTLPLEGAFAYRSPFYLEGKSRYVLTRAPGLAYAVGVITLLSALDWIRLGALPWHAIVIDALNIPYSKEEAK